MNRIRMAELWVILSLIPAKMALESALGGSVVPRGWLLHSARLALFQRVLHLIVVFVVLLAWAVRFVTLNVEARKHFANTIYYEMGEKIAFEKDFFRTEDANMDGYYILVKSATIYPYEVFAEMMNLELPPQGDLFRADYVYDVEVTIFNEDNEEGGIDMFNTALIHAGLGMRVDNTLWELLYPQLQGSYTFRARTYSQMDFHFPFVIETELNQRAYDLERLKTTPFFLNLTEYPNQKRVRVGPLE